MRYGTHFEINAHRPTTARVESLVLSLSRLLFRMHQPTADTPARRAATPPSKSAWYIQVCTTAGFRRLSSRTSRKSPDGLGRPGFISIASTGMPSAAMRGASSPSVVREMTWGSKRLRSRRSKILNSIISAPPVESPVMMKAIDIKPDPVLVWY